MVTWEVNEHFAKRVVMPTALPEVNVLAQSRAGISRQMRNTTSPTEQMKLRLIRNEIDSLIETL